MSFYEGRMGRLEYFTGSVGLLLLIVMVWLMGSWVLGFVLGFTGNFPNDSELQEFTNSIFFVVLFLAFPFRLSLIVKRFHDFDYSGWHYLALYVPILGLVYECYLLFREGTRGSFGNIILKYLNTGNGRLVRSLRIPAWP